MDGHAGQREVAAACRGWRDDASTRECWHTYHLIGDVLRSEELASPPAHDAAFLQRLNGRLAAEPVPLAPSRVSAAAPSRARRSLLWPVALSAGVALVAGVLVVARVPSPEAPTLAVAPSQGQPELRVVNGQLIRDARLDRYLAAHRKGANGSALAMPGDVMRSVDTIVLEGR